MTNITAAAPGLALPTNHDLKEAKPPQTVQTATEQTGSDKPAAPVASVSVQLSASYSYSASTYTHASYSAQSLTYDPPPKPEIPPPPSNEVSGTSAINPDTERTAAASTILSFINKQLTFDATDGASKENLQGRLEAGLEGFLKGYNEAFEQISAMGALTPEVRAAVEQTYNDVLKGIGALAEHFGLENPAPALLTPEEGNNTASIAATNTVLESNGKLLALDSVKELQANLNLTTMLEASSSFYDRVEAQRETSQGFSFSLKTADGDTVTIQASSLFTEDYESSKTGGNAENLTRYDSQSSHSFSLEVNGDLDSDELEAINNLLTQINDIAEDFFQGDLSNAYEKALQLGINDDEIVAFSLNLIQTQSTQVESTYGAIANANNEDLLTPHETTNVPANNQLDIMAQFVRQIEEMRVRSEELGINSVQLFELTLSVSHQSTSNESQHEQFDPFMAKMLGALERNAI